MTEAKSVSSEVEVAVDPDTAFRAFTEELDLWWVRGPINFWSEGHRVVEVRCEPGVGGRIMEVLDKPVSDDVFIRAHITAWEPPARLCWDSAQDDVATEETGTITVKGFAKTVRTHRVVGILDTCGEGRVIRKEQDGLLLILDQRKLVGVRLEEARRMLIEVSDRLKQ